MPRQPAWNLDSVALRELQTKLEQEQNLPAGVLAGFIAAVVAAVTWAALTFVTHFQIGYMAIGVGFLVGLAVQYFGKGITPAFAVTGCLLSLFGCALGNVLWICGLVAQQESVPLVEILSHITPGRAMFLLKETFQPIDALFYGIALYAGWNCSMRRITPEELKALRPNQPVA